MISRRQVIVLLASLVLVSAPALAVKPTQDELAEARKWVGDHFGQAKSVGAKTPFSFVYDGKPSSDLLSGWGFSESEKKLDAHRTETTQTYTDKATGLEMRCVRVTYDDYPVAEWTLYFKNSGDKNTPILGNIQGLDVSFERAGEGEFVLHGNSGDSNGPQSYEPFHKTLAPGAKERFVPSGGWGTCGAYPYYNLQTPGGGAIIVIGWPGEWASNFVRDDKNGLKITAGQSMTHVSLMPGEEIRSPLAVLLFYKGLDLVRSQNLWRSWMVAHNIPRTADGKLPTPQLCGNNCHEVGFVSVSEQNQNEFINLYADKGLKIDYWWLDAGWFDCNGDWWLTGTWEPDKARFPKGLKPVSDCAHSRGAGFVTWFDAERVGGPDSWLAKNHPEWLTPGDWGSSLLNLGEPAARKWLVDHIDKSVTESGIDIYRQDFNMPPMSAWRSRDTADRQGMTENLHNQGYLWWWDELRRRHPNIRIDSCASGGRRNDLETMRRAVPLHRTDFNFEPNSQQAHHYALASWIPYNGSGYMVGKSVVPPPDCPSVPVPDDFDAYFFRSAMASSIVTCIDVRKADLNYDLGRRLFEQYKRVAKYYLSDFYPLTPYSLASEAWMAWQYDKSESGDGVVQAFRRAKSTEATQTFKLCGLDSAAKYKITNLDTDTPTQMSGKDLIEQGLTVELKEAPGAALIAYERLK